MTATPQDARDRKFVLVTAGTTGGAASLTGEMVALTPSALSALADPARAAAVRGIIVDLTGPRRRWLGALKRCADQGVFQRIPTVALVASAEAAGDAARLRVPATVWCEGDGGAALERALAVCACLAGPPMPTADTPTYAGLREAHRELREMHQRLRARAEDDEVRGAMIVHDLRAPLSVVHGTVGELLLDLPEGPDRELVVLAERASAQLAALVDRLEQLYAGAGEPSHPERVDLAALAVGVAEGLRHAPVARGKALTVRHDGPTHLVADRQDLVRVLSNLVGNALRHARSHVEIAVQAGERELELHVIDDGPGLPPAMRERPFVRAGRTPGAGRMGLGLAIVQRAVMRHEGCAEALDRSAHEGVPGARFIVRLPRR